MVRLICLSLEDIALDAVQKVSTEDNVGVYWMLARDFWLVAQASPNPPIKYYYHIAHIF